MAYSEKGGKVEWPRRVQWPFFSLASKLNFTLFDICAKIKGKKWKVVLLLQKTVSYKCLNLQIYPQF